MSHSLVTSPKPMSSKIPFRLVRVSIHFNVHWTNFNKSSNPNTGLPSF